MKALTANGGLMSRLRIFLGCVLAVGVSALVRAAPVADELLLAPASFSHPSLSPDGKRMAVVTDTGHAQRGLVIGELGEGTFKPLMKTSVPGLVAVDRYAWQTSDVLLIWADVGAGDGDVWAMLDTRSRVLVPMHHLYANLVRTNWGDADHVLIYDLCEHDQLCLYNWNIRLNDGRPFAKPVPIVTARGFEVLADKEVVTRKSGDSDEDRLRWNPTTQLWEPYVAPAPKTAEPSATGDGFALANERLVQLDAATAAGPKLFTSGTRRTVGVNLLVAPGLRALHPDLEAPAVAVAKALRGQQVQWIEISDDLNTALISAHVPGAPDTYYLWTRTGGLLTLQASRPELAGVHLAQSHVMNDWLGDGTPVTVVLPAPGVAHGPLLIRTVDMKEADSVLRSAEFEGEVQVLAQHGLTIVTVPVTIGPASGQGSAWRQWVAARVQRAADRGVQMGLATRERICVWGEDFGGYAALAAAALAPQPGYACVLAVNVPMQYDTMSKPLRTQVGNLERIFIASPAAVTMWHSLWLEDGQHDQALANPVSWSGQLPSHIFLAYRMYAGQNGPAIKWDASAFESAVKKSGRNLDFYDPEANFDDEAKWNASLYEALAKYATEAAPP
jgi:hypothetical protein